MTNFGIGKIGFFEINGEEIKDKKPTSINEDESVFLLTDKNGKEFYVTVSDDDSTQDADESNIGEIAADYFIPDGRTAENMLLEKREDGLYQITVVPWGSTKKDGMKYANDCLSRIIANYYPNIKLYSDDYNALINSLMQINGINNPDIIYDNQKIILPIPAWDENGALLGFIEPTEHNANPNPPEEEDLVDPSTSEYPTMDKIDDMETFISNYGDALKAMDVDTDTLSYNEELGALTYKYNDQVYTIVRNEDGTWFQTGIKFENGVAVEFIAEYDANGETLLNYKASLLGLEESEGTQGNGDGASEEKANIDNVTPDLLSDDATKTTLSMLGINENTTLTYDESTGSYKSAANENEEYFTLSKGDDDTTWTRTNYDASGNPTSSSEIKTDNNTEITITQYDALNNKTSTTTYTKNDDSWNYAYTPAGENPTTSISIDDTTLTASKAKEIFDAAYEALSEMTSTTFSLNEKIYSIDEQINGSWKITEKTTTENPEIQTSKETSSPLEIDTMALEGLTEAEGVKRYTYLFDDREIVVCQQGDFYWTTNDNGSEISIYNENGKLEFETTNEEGKFVYIEYNDDGSYTKRVKIDGNSYSEIIYNADGTIKEDTIIGNLDEIAKGCQTYQELMSSSSPTTSFNNIIVGEILNLNNQHFMEIYEKYEEQINKYIENLDMDSKTKDKLIAKLDDLKNSSGQQGNLETHPVGSTTIEFPASFEPNELVSLLGGQYTATSDSGVKFTVEITDSGYTSTRTSTNENGDRFVSQVTYNVDGKPKYETGTKTNANGQKYEYSIEYKEDGSYIYYEAINAINSGEPAKYKKTEYDSNGNIVTKYDSKNGNFVSTEEISGDIGSLKDEYYTYYKLFTTYNSSQGSYLTNENIKDILTLNDEHLKEIARLYKDEILDFINTENNETIDKTIQDEIINKLIEFGFIEPQDPITWVDNPST